ncbi:MAG: prevent-host-death protein [Ardenticatenia bacterium]|jgi:prevent-host-death family protein|nr:MAG: prevent-host-death protein [Ardenticatenia bacterium]
MSTTTVGVRELKTRLSAYLRRVKAGDTVIILERGVPVGRIVPVNASLEVRAQRLVEAGLVAWNGQRLPPAAPLARTRGGRTVADLLLEERE